MRLLVVVIFSLGLLDAIPARADEPPARPALSLMDVIGDGTGLVLDVAMLRPTHDADFTVVHPRLVLQHVAASGIGGYAGINAGMTVRDSGSNAFALGNLELGGVYRHVVHPGLELGLRAAFVVDTARGDGVSDNAAATLLTRPGDVATAAPGHWLRLGIAPTFRSGTEFVHLEAGIDVPVDQGTPVNVLSHMSLGAGSGLGTERWGFTAELSGLLVSARESSETLVVAGLSARYHHGPASPYIALSGPLSDGLLGELVSLTVGISFAQ